MMKQPRINGWRSRLAFDCLVKDFQMLALIAVGFQHFFSNTPANPLGMIYRFSTEDVSAEKVRV
jgi:hypothetical protein